MRDPRRDEDATPEQLFGVVIALILILFPIIMLLAFPDNAIVGLVLGEGRIFAVWAIILILLLAYRDKFDRIVVSYLAKMRKKGKQ